MKLVALFYLALPPFLWQRNRMLQHHNFVAMASEEGKIFIVLLQREVRPSIYYEI